jgi:hypothetical protein
VPSQTADKRSLIYNASNLSTFDTKTDYRYERREAMRGISSRERLKKCGTVPHGPVTLTLKSLKIIQRGLTTCGSVWGCPVCSAKILTHRSHEVDAAMSAWVKQGGYFIFETLTLSHQKGEPVESQRSALRVGWDAINGGSFSANHKKAGQEGYLKIVEATHGAHGFHLHIHVLRFMKGELPEAQLNKWMDKTFSKWQKSITTAGFMPPSPKAHVIRRVHNFEGIKSYFTKGFDNPSLQEPGVKSNSIWNVLTAAIANPKSTHTFTWRSWESGSHGMRQMTWARNLRKSLGMGEEIEDGEIAELPVPLMQIEPDDVPRYGHSGRTQSQLRKHLQAGDLGAATALLDSKGIGYRLLLDEPSNHQEGHPLPQFI